MAAKLPFSTSSLGRIAVEVCDRYLKREIVDLFKPGDFLRLALLDVHGTLDDAGEAGARVALRAIHEAGVGINEIVCRHLTAIVEVGVVAQPEGVRHAIGRSAHGLRQLQNQLGVCGIPVVERPVYGLVDDVVLGTRRRMRVEAAEARRVRCSHPERAALARRLLRVRRAGADDGDRGDREPCQFTHQPIPLVNILVGAHSILPCLSVQEECLSRSQPCRESRITHASPPPRLNGEEIDFASPGQV